ncbi:hypothetical protein [Wenxinia marina]|uniref:Uncharacterized protein n=1 Tax=Wenxinia marina DSM 24838 TaxID=1123501 RepID=A0A0D0PAA5_9RHOB|nr:hypothetical protein [Wenxinia marina]KIQ68436.1 hypothetical protein Wenmar_03083 [Wenxinia marina DSM 24838]GGL72280.1 hypothetical protein GCM10011392_28530 [Wenxinia marina]
MDESAVTFDQRLKSLSRKHSRIRQNGYAGRMNRDGLVVMVPRRRGPAFPLRGFLGVILAALAFKTFLLVSLGTEEYTARVDALASGTLVEKGGAWVMALDPVTQALAGVVTDLL